MPRRGDAAVAPLVVLSLLSGFHARPAGSAGDVRERAARWLESYDRVLAALVATETCTQRVRRVTTYDASTTTRVLVSEFAWVPVLEGHDVLGVRDVRQVDGRPIEGASRLEALLRAPAGERDARIAALLAESVRLLEVPTAVNFNFPTFALGYLRPENASRARWSVRDGRALSATAMLRFRETARTLVRTPEGRAVKAEGWFEVDRASGQVNEAGVTLHDAHAVDAPMPGVEAVQYEARVRFAREPRLDVWVPTVMEDRYDWRRRSVDTGNTARALVIEGRSTYADFRRFDTTVRIVPK